MRNNDSCKQRVVVVPNKGRLGNQLFSFAVCYSIAKSNGLCYKGNSAVCNTFEHSTLLMANACAPTARRTTPAPLQRHERLSISLSLSPKKSIFRREAGAASGSTDLVELCVVR